MPHHEWNENYRTGQLPWDSGQPDEHLIQFVRSAAVVPGRALDVGCGTGTNARWLAEQGFDVLGVDLAPIAVEKARAKTAGVRGCRFEVDDFLRAPPAGAFSFVFDRGCWHVFDDAADRALFARNVSGLLGPGGHWLSLMGSTEGPAREVGPPRRSARDIAEAIEPALEIVSLRAASFEGLPMSAPRSWVCVARRREFPAQPSTR